MSPTLGPLDDVVDAVGHVPARLAVTAASLADGVAARLDLPRIALGPAHGTRRPGLVGAGRAPSPGAVAAATEALAQDAWVVVLDDPAVVPLVARRAEVVVLLTLPGRAGLRAPGRARDPRHRVGHRVGRRLDRLPGDVPDLIVVRLHGPADAHTWLTRLPRGT